MLNPIRIKRKNSKTPKEESTLWTIKQLQQSYKDPHLMIIDLRSCGIFRGGPPPDTKETPTEYHQGHLFLALNLNLENTTTIEGIEEEIHTGRNSAGGTFLDTLVLAITSGFHFLFYTQDGSDMSLLENICGITITQNDETYSFDEENVHWLEGGFNAIYKHNTMKKFCADTKTLLGFEEELEEPEYSQILPHLFVGGAICSPAQFDELHHQGVKHIINVSNIERQQNGFKCTFIYADDDQTETLTRLFHEVADLIEESEQKGEGVFVHCQRGLSRSPTLVMAYLMIKKQFSLAKLLSL
jgi:hypothetical protein